MKRRIVKKQINKHSRLELARYKEHLSGHHVRADHLKALGQIVRQRLSTLRSSRYRKKPIYRKAIAWTLAVDDEIVLKGTYQ